MARAETLTLISTKELVINLNGLYLLGYAGLFGMCTFTTCMHARCYISQYVLTYSHLGYICRRYFKLSIKHSFWSEVFFFSGVIAYRSLREFTWRFSLCLRFLNYNPARHQFGALQHKTLRRRCSAALCTSYCIRFPSDKLLRYRTVDEQVSRAAWLYIVYL